MLKKGYYTACPIKGGQCDILFFCLSLLGKPGGQGQKKANYATPNKKNSLGVGSFLVFQ